MVIQVLLWRSRFMLRVGVGWDSSMDRHVPEEQPVE